VLTRALSQKTLPAGQHATSCVCGVPLNTNLTLYWNLAYSCLGVTVIISMITVDGKVVARQFAFMSNLVNCFARIEC